MKIISRIVVAFSIFAIAGMAFLGLAFRASYSNITSQANYTDLVQVAELQESIMENSADLFLNKMSAIPFVLCVTPESELEYFFSGSRQQVAVKKVFRGFGLTEGDKIYLAFRTDIAVGEYGTSVECGFVNFMEPGKNYLVFISEKIDVLKEEEYPVYRISDQFVFQPFFCYNNDFSKVVVPVEFPTYVPYTEVANNEFFATSEESMQKWYNLKSILLDTYPM